MGDYWQKTIDILQDAADPIVTKPKLSDKYLTKPPFRFLHDVITAVRPCLFPFEPSVEDVWPCRCKRRLDSLLVYSKAKNWIQNHLRCR